MPKIEDTNRYDKNNYINEKLEQFDTDFNNIYNFAVSPFKFIILIKVSLLSVLHISWFVNGKYMILSSVCVFIIAIISSSSLTSTGK